jgi:hypothetical protein
MRTLIINLLATALLLFGAASASAFAVNMTINPGSVSTGVALSASDQIILDVYLDAPTAGLFIVNPAVLFDDTAGVAFERFPGPLATPNGSTNPTYILFSGGKVPKFLVPVQTPLNQWAGFNQPGKKQISVEYIENALLSTPATGNNIWIGTIVFHVTPAYAGGELDFDLALLGNGSTGMQTQVGGFPVDVQGSTTVSGSYVFGLPVVPEPTTALLIGFGLVGLTLAGRRQS